MKATKDFTEWGVVVKAGDELKSGQFEADQVQSLLAKGLVVDDKAKKEPAKAEKGKPK
jgi:hypothetical protein